MKNKVIQVSAAFALVLSTNSPLPAQYLNACSAGWRGTFQQSPTAFPVSFGGFQRMPFFLAAGNGAVVGDSAGNIGTLTQEFTGRGVQVLQRTFSIGVPPVAGVWDGTLSLWAGLNSVQYAQAGTTTPATLVSIPNEAISGMLFDGAYLWVSGRSLHRYSYSYSRGTMIPQIQTSTNYSYSKAPLKVLASDGINLWSLQNGNLLQTDQNGVLVGSFSVGSTVSGALYDGAYLWLAYSDSPVLKRLDPGTGTVISQSTVSGNVTALTFDGTFVWVASQSTSTVNKVRACDGSVGMSYTIPNPNGIIYDRSTMAIWVASPNVSDPHSGTFTVFQ